MNSGVFTQSNEAEETQKKARFIIYNTGRGRYRASLLYSVIDWCAGIFKSKQTGRREKRIFTRHTITHERVNNVHKCVHGNGNILITLWGFVCVHVQRGWLGKMESGCVGKVRLIRETESQKLVGGGGRVQLHLVHKQKMANNNKYETSRVQLLTRIFV